MIDYIFKITQSQVNKYIELTGDNNIVHKYSNEFYDFPIVHGSYVLGIVSRYIGTVFPGKGTIIGSINARFENPLRIGKKYKLTIIKSHTISGLYGHQIEIEIQNIDSIKIIKCVSISILCFNKGELTREVNLL